jgi:hypothetical protein
VKKKLILAEGNDACYFLLNLLSKMKIEDIQISNFGGVKDITNHISALKGMDGFDSVNSILIFRDSETSTKSACESVNSSLKITNIIKTDIKPFIMNCQNDRRIGFVLFPGMDENGELYDCGTLEHLCLHLLKEKSVNEKIKTYIDDFQLKNSKFVKPHKNELHTSLSFTDKFVGLKIGETANAGGFDFDSPYLSPFLKIINEM